ncbi:MAG: hypothetical protein HKN27_17555 [Silicimonas sp.]|nr:hypothetical protein [Silicimonas sp.]
MKYVFPVLALGLAGCTELGLTPAPKPEPVPQTATNAAPPPPRAARTVEQFDTTTEAQRAAASQPASGGRSLGTEVASLGDPSQPGFWIETSLVDEVGAGRITVATGQSAEVELRPTEGSARVSLAAWRILEVPLTELAEVEVFAN